MMATELELRSPTRQFGATNLKKAVDVSKNSTLSRNASQGSTFNRGIRSTVGRRTGLDVIGKKVIRKDARGLENFDDYWTESEAEITFNLEEHLNKQTGGQNLKIAAAKRQEKKPSNTSLASTASQRARNNRGRRTGLDVKSGKTIRKTAQGLEVFDDYWTESEADETGTINLTGLIKEAQLSQQPQLPVSENVAACERQTAVDSDHVDSSQAAKNETPTIDNEDLNVEQTVSIVSESSNSGIKISTKDEHRSRAKVNDTASQRSGDDLTETPRQQDENTNPTVVTYEITRKITRSSSRKRAAENAGSPQTSDNERSSTKNLKRSSRSRKKKPNEKEASDKVNGPAASSNLESNEYSEKFEENSEKTPSQENSNVNPKDKSSDLKEKSSRRQAANHDLENVSDVNLKHGKSAHSLPRNRSKDVKLNNVTVDEINNNDDEAVRTTLTENDEGLTNNTFTKESEEIDVGGAKLNETYTERDEVKQGPNNQEQSATLKGSNVNGDSTVDNTPNINISSHSDQKKTDPKSRSRKRKGTTGKKSSAKNSKKKHNEPPDKSMSSTAHGDKVVTEPNCILDEVSKSNSDQQQSAESKSPQTKSKKQGKKKSNKKSKKSAKKDTENANVLLELEAEKFVEYVVLNEDPVLHLSGCTDEDTPAAELPNNKQGFAHVLLVTDPTKISDRSERYGTGLTNGSSPPKSSQQATLNIGGEATGSWTKSAVMEDLTPNSAIKSFRTRKRLSYSADDNRTGDLSSQLTQDDDNTQSHADGTRESTREITKDDQTDGDAILPSSEADVFSHDQIAAQNTHDNKSVESKLSPRKEESKSVEPVEIVSRVRTRSETSSNSKQIKSSKRQRHKSLPQKSKIVSAPVVNGKAQNYRRSLANNHVLNVTVDVNNRVKQTEKSQTAIVSPNSNKENANQNIEKHAAGKSNRKSSTTVINKLFKQLSTVRKNQMNLTVSEHSETDSESNIRFISLCNPSKGLHSKEVRKGPELPLSDEPEKSLQHSTSPMLSEGKNINGDSSVSNSNVLLQPNSSQSPLSNLSQKEISYVLSDEDEDFIVIVNKPELDKIITPGKTRKRASGRRSSKNTSLHKNSDAQNVIEPVDHINNLANGHDAGGSVFPIHTPPPSKKPKESRKKGKNKVEMGESQKTQGKLLNEDDSDCLVVIDPPLSKKVKGRKSGNKNKDSSYEKANEHESKQSDNKKVGPANEKPLNTKQIPFARLLNDEENGNIKEPSPDVIKKATKKNLRRHSLDVSTPIKHVLEVIDKVASGDATHAYTSRDDTHNQNDVLKKTPKNNLKRHSSDVATPNNYSSGAEDRVTSGAITPANTSQPAWGDADMQDFDQNGDDLPSHLLYPPSGPSVRPRRRESMEIDINTDDSDDEDDYDVEIDDDNDDMDNVNVGNGTDTVKEEQNGEENQKSNSAEDGTKGDNSFGSKTLTPMFTPRQEQQEKSKKRVTISNFVLPSPKHSGPSSVETPATQRKSILKTPGSSHTYKRASNGTPFKRPSGTPYRRSGASSLYRKSGVTTPFTGSSTATPLSTDGPIHVFEMTNSETPHLPREAKPLVTKIIHPDPAPDGVRRSKRTRLKPLEWYKNERALYDKRKSGGFVIVDVAEPFPEKKYKKMSKLEKKLHQIRRNQELERKQRKLSMHVKVPEEIVLAESDEIPVVDEDSPDELTTRSCVKVQESFQYWGPSGLDLTPQDPYIISKFFQEKTFSAGEVILRPGEEKPTQLVTGSTMLFNILDGKLAVTIHETTSILQTRDVFYVPPENTYSLKNLRNTSAKLFFTQVKGQDS